MIVHDDALQQAVAEADLAANPTEVVEQEIADGAEELSSSAEELGSISRQVEKTGGMVESLENFMDGFMSRVPEGEWTPAIARQYRVGMGALMTAHGYKVDLDKVSASFEDAGVKQTNDENREENKTKTKGLISKLLEALKAALSAMGNAIARFAKSLINNAFVLRKAGMNLQATARALKGEPPTGEVQGQHDWEYYFQMKPNGGDPTASKVIGDAAMEIDALLGGWDQSFKSQIHSLGANAHPVEEGVTKIILSGGVTLEVKGVDEHLKGGTQLANATIKVTKSEYPKHRINYLSRHEMEEVGKVMVANAEKMKHLTERSKPMVTELNKLLTSFQNAEVKVADHIAGAQKLIAKYPLAMHTLIPLIASISLKAWRHAGAGAVLVKKDPSAKADKKGGGSSSGGLFSHRGNGEFLAEIEKHKDDPKAARHFITNSLNNGRYKADVLKSAVPEAAKVVPGLWEDFNESAGKIETDESKLDHFAYGDAVTGLERNFSKKRFDYVMKLAAK